MVKSGYRVFTSNQQRKEANQNHDHHHQDRCRHRPRGDDPFTRRLLPQEVLPAARSLQEQVRYRNQPPQSVVDPFFEKSRAIYGPAFLLRKQNRYREIP
jgi:hypothetical protein